MFIQMACSPIYEAPTYTLWVILVLSRMDGLETSTFTDNPNASHKSFLHEQPFFRPAIIPPHTAMAYAESALNSEYVRPAKYAMYTLNTIDTRTLEIPFSIPLEKAAGLDIPSNLRHNTS